MNVTEQEAQQLLKTHSINQAGQFSPDVVRAQPRIGNPLPRYAAALEIKKVRKHEEDDLINRLIEVGHLNGWVCAHFRPAMMKDGSWRTAVSGDGKGFPDLVFARENDPSHFNDVLFVETKSETGKLTMDQTMWKMLLEKTLTEYWLVRPSTEEAFIKRLSESSRREI